MKKRLLAILSIITITTFYAFYQKKTLENQFRQSSEQNVLKKLPFSNFKTLTGSDFSTSTLLNKKSGLVVIHFWGTWCGPCEAELPDLVSFSEKYIANEEVKFILVAVNDDASKVNKRVSGFKKLSLVWLLDNNNVYKDRFGSTRVPETYVFNYQGYLLKKFVGPQNWSTDIYLQLFQEFLELNLNKF